MKLLLFSSTVESSSFKKSKNFSNLPIYLTLVTGDFIAYEYSDQMPSSPLFCSNSTYSYTLYSWNPLKRTDNDAGPWGLITELTIYLGSNMFNYWQMNPPKIT